MGSFNVGCCVTGQNITEGDKAVVIMMIKVKSHFAESPRWSFIGMPMVGEYNDYGRFVFDENDEAYKSNIAYLERVYSPNKIEAGKTSKDYNQYHDYMELTFEDLIKGDRDDGVGRDLFDSASAGKLFVLHDDYHKDRVPMAFFAVKQDVYNKIVATRSKGYYVNKIQHIRDTFIEKYPWVFEEHGFDELMDFIDYGQPTKFPARPGVDYRELRMDSRVSRLDFGEHDVPVCHTRSVLTSILDPVFKVEHLYELWNELRLTGKDINPFVPTSQDGFVLPYAMHQISLQMIGNNQTVLGSKYPMGFCIDPIVITTDIGAIDYMHWYGDGIPLDVISKLPPAERGGFKLSDLSRMGYNQIRGTVHETEIWFLIPESEIKEWLERFVRE